MTQHDLYLSGVEGNRLNCQYMITPMITAVLSTHECFTLRYSMARLYIPERSS